MCHSGSIVLPNRLKRQLEEDVQNHRSLRRPDGCRAPQRLLIIGAGLGAIQVLDALTDCQETQVMGLVDDKEGLHGQSLLGSSVLGPLSLVSSFWKREQFDCAVIAGTKDRDFRRKTFERLTNEGIVFTNVIHSSAVISLHAEIGVGNVILAGCCIGAGTKIGDNNFLSGSVSLEHHNQLGNHCMFGPAVFTSGEVAIGNSVRFGTGIFIEPSLSVGDDSVIASGAVLIGNVPRKSVVKTKVNYRVSALSS